MLQKKLSNLNCPAAPPPGIGSAVQGELGMAGNGNARGKDYPPTDTPVILPPTLCPRLPSCRHQDTSKANAIKKALAATRSTTTSCFCVCFCCELPPPPLAPALDVCAGECSSPEVPQRASRSGQGHGVKKINAANDFVMAATLAIAVGRDPLKCLYPMPPAHTPLIGVVSPGLAEFAQDGGARQRCRAREQGHMLRPH